MVDSKNKSLIACFLVAVLVSGCGRELTFDDVRSWYEKQPDGYSEFIEFGNNAKYQGKYDKAKEYYERAMEWAEVEWGPNDLRIVTPAVCYAKMQTGLGKFADAERLYKRAWEIQKLHLPPNHKEVIEVRKELAAVLMQQYKKDEADKVLAGLKSSSSKRAGKKRRRRH